jgi:uncharacterized protein
MSIMADVPVTVCITFCVRRTLTVFLIVFSIVSLSGCATYYQQNVAFQRAIARGEYKEAVDHLEGDRTVTAKRNRLLFYLEKGTALHMAEYFTASNDVLENAYLFVEDHMRNYGLEVLSFVTNPAVVPYPGEDFERVQIHYFKALNHVMLGNLQDALVECRRINIKLNEINDRYDAGKQNRYAGDAFAWTVMGIIFDASGEYNNAFTSYRNALELYETDYARDYNLGAPGQLIQDLLTSADKAGLRDEYSFYKKRYPQENPSIQETTHNGQVVVFWNNGLGPIKTEDSLNFFIQRGAGGSVVFVNEEEGFWLPLPATGSASHSGLAGLRFIRMALPRYVERPPVYDHCVVSFEDREYHLEKAQDINGIAFLNLRDRMGRELAHALLRVALKYGVEQAVRKEDEAAGMLVSLLGAITEKADTRNWQTLPHSIHYTRFAMPRGEHLLRFSRFTHDGRQYDTYRSVHVEPGETSFVTFFDPQTRYADY